MSFDPKDPQSLERLREATVILDAMSKDASLIVQVPLEDRKRLLAAVSLLFNPSPSQRRNMVKASKRKWKAERVKGDESKLHETGIRELRRRPTFTTPNFYPPKELHDHPERADDAEAAAALPQVEERHCYIC